MTSTRATYRQPDRRNAAISLRRRPTTASESPAIRKRIRITEPRLLGMTPATAPAQRPYPSRSSPTTLQKAKPRSGSRPKKAKVRGNAARPTASMPTHQTMNSLITLKLTRRSGPVARRWDDGGRAAARLVAGAEEQERHGQQHAQGAPASRRLRRQAAGGGPAAGDAAPPRRNRPRGPGYGRNGDGRGDRSRPQPQEGDGRATGRGARAAGGGQG